MAAIGWRTQHRRSVGTGREVKLIVWRKKLSKVGVVAVPAVAWSVLAPR